MKGSPLKKKTTINWKGSFQKLTETFDNTHYLFPARYCFNCRVDIIITCYTTFCIQLMHSNLPEAEGSVRCTTLVISSQALCVYIHFPAIYMTLPVYLSFWQLPCSSVIWFLSRFRVSDWPTFCLSEIKVFIIMINFIIRNHFSFSTFNLIFLWFNPNLSNYTLLLLSISFQM